MTDIELDTPSTDTMRLTADFVQVVAHDLILDHPERRSAADGFPRRALVHDVDDALTLNYNNDYPAGVHIIGQLTVESLTLENQNLLDVIKELRQELRVLRGSLEELRRGVYVDLAGVAEDELDGDLTTNKALRKLGEKLNLGPIPTP
jgi:hypothetical protein